MQDIKKIINTTPIISIVISIICVVIFFTINYLTAYNPDAKIAYSIVFGANYHTFTLGLKQYYRLITSMFVHTDYLHLLMNLISFYYLGISLERVYGKQKYLVLVIVSTLTASLFQLAFSPNVVSYGLSGSLYGLLAVTCIIYYKLGILFSNKFFIYIIIVNVIISFGPNIASFAHLGGAIGGVFIYLGYIEKIFDAKMKQSILISLILMFFGFGYKLYNLKKIKPIYPGTDLRVLEIYRNFNLFNYASEKEAQLHNIYQEAIKNE